MVRSLFSQAYTAEEGNKAEYKAALDECREYIRARQAELKDLRGVDFNNKIKTLVTLYIDEMKPVITEYIMGTNEINTTRLASKLYEDINQFGPITSALEDKSLTDIYCFGYGPGTLFVMRGRKFEPVYDINGNELYFKSADEIESIVNKLASFQGIRLTKSNPILYGQTIQGFRLTASDASISSDIIMPDGSKAKSPMFSLRMGMKADITLDTMVHELKTIHPDIAKVMMAIAKMRGLKVMLSGVPGTGKTTMVVELLKKMEDLFIFTIERTPEIALWTYDNNGRRKGVVKSLVANMDNIESSDTSKATPYNLYLLTLREKVDILVLGEIRSTSEILVALEAAVAGQGILATIHGEDEETTLERLIKDTQQAKKVNRSEAMEEVYLSVNIVISMFASQVDGKIRVRCISEIVKEETPYGIRLKGNRLYEFHTYDKTINPETGSIHGYYQKVGVPTKRLMRYIEDSILTPEEEEILTKPASPEHPIPLSEVWD